MLSLRTHGKEVIEYLMRSYDLVVELVVTRRVRQEHVAVRDEDVEDVDD